MPLRFVPITEENRREVENLQLFPEQRSYSESVPECLAEAEQTREWRTVGIYDGPTVVGLPCMDALPSRNRRGQLWLDRLLIDRAYQGAGLWCGGGGRPAGAPAQGVWKGPGFSERIRRQPGGDPSV